MQVFLWWQSGSVDTCRPWVEPLAGSPRPAKLAQSPAQSTANSQRGQNGRNADKTVILVSTGISIHLQFLREKTSNMNSEKSFLVIGIWKKAISANSTKKTLLHIYSAKLLCTLVCVILSLGRTVQSSKEVQLNIILNQVKSKLLSFLLFMERFELE